MANADAMDGAQLSAGKLLPVLGSFSVHAALLLFFVVFNSAYMALNPAKPSSSSHAVVTLTTVPPGPKSVRKIFRPSLTHSSTGISASSKKLEPVSQGHLSQEGALPSSRSFQAGETHPLNDYLLGLRQLIENRKVYPPQSRRMRESGTVLVALEVLRDGTIREVKLKAHSQFARLDRAALETVAGVQRYKPIPDSVSGDRVTVEVPIEFLL